MGASTPHNRPNPGESNPPPATYGPRRKNLAPLFCLSIALSLGASLIGFILVSSCSINDGVYIVRLSSNHSSPIQVSVGYGGTWVKTVNTSFSLIPAGQLPDETGSLIAQFKNRLECYQDTSTTGTRAGTNPPTNGTSRILVSDVYTCLYGNITSVDMATIEALLNMSDDLQYRVFPFGLYIAFFVLFQLSTVILWIMLTIRWGTQVEKGILAVVAQVNGYALTLGFMLALATRQACAGLIFPRTGTGVGVLDAAAADIYVAEGETLQALQWAMVSACAAVQACLTSLFVQRHAVGDDDNNVEVSFLPAVNISFAEMRRRLCF